jgi:hypothetical protein
LEDAEEANDVTPEYGAETIRLSAQGLVALFVVFYRINVQHQRA